MQVEDKQAAVSRIQPSVTVPYHEECFLQLWEKAKDSVRMLSMD